MRTHSFVRFVAAVAVVLSWVSLSAVEDPGPRVIEITGNDQMKFSVTNIAVKPGEAVTVRLKSVGTLPKIAMAHNFVLLAAGTDAAAFADSAALSPSTQYIPPAMKGKVLAMTKLAGPGETVSVTFKAPAKPGSYTFLCSFPGHFVAGMKGVLVVK